MTAIQQEMADKLGVTRPHLSGVVTGRIRPGGRLALRLAELTQTSADLWLGDDAAKKQATWWAYRNSVKWGK